MGSEAPISLPVIDFSKPELKHGTPEWDSLKTQVWKAIEEYGCFKALFNKIPLELQKAAFGALEELFDLPSQTKRHNISEKPFHGYAGGNPRVSLYESIGFDDANILEKVESSTNAFWPNGNPNFSKTIQSFSMRVSDLDQTIRRMIVESLGLEKYLDEHMNSTYYLLRVMKYEAPKSMEKKTGLISHTDKNVITILSQNQIDGLEIQTKDGSWINVKCSPDSFIILAGESLNAWTNGRSHTPIRRVMTSGNDARYSAALFSVFKAGYMVNVPEELVDEEHPLLYKPFDYSEFLAFQKKESGMRFYFSLKAYCGV